VITSHIVIFFLFVFYQAIMTNSKFSFDDDDDRPLSVAFAAFTASSADSSVRLSSAPSSRSSRGGDAFGVGLGSNDRFVNNHLSSDGNEYDNNLGPGIIGMNSEGTLASGGMDGFGMMRPHLEV
jgi:hypothetical protein